MEGAIADYLQVLQLSQAMGDFTARAPPRPTCGPAAAAPCSHLDADCGWLHSKQGDTDALGAVADLYTETGDLERAGRYYDLYIAAISSGLSSNVD